jgi:regulator of protease activity HflC (stomatin/prohibitin superfamily)
MEMQRLTVIVFTTFDIRKEIVIMYTKTHIRKHERGLLFRHGDFVRLLAPGTYRIPVWNALSDCIEVVDTLKTRFEHALLDVLLNSADLREALLVLDLSDSQRALVWKDGRLFQIVGPGRHAYWKAGAQQLDVETFDIEAFRFAHAKLASILQHADAAKWLDGVQVDEGAVSLLYRGGVLIDRLGQGLHVYWKGTGKVRFKTVDLREQVADVAGQEIMTSDKVTLRVNLVVTYVVTDVLASVNATADYAQALYREAQLVLRAAVGAKTLDAILGDKESVGAEVRDALTARASALGVAVKSVGLRDIILPGDMKTLLNQVIAATKEAEANLIKRREETAAARSQANTAKLLADNPQLARLKELELLKDVLAGAKTTFVFGNGDIADQVRGLITSDKTDG